MVYVYQSARFLHYLFDDVAPFCLQSTWIIYILSSTLKAPIVDSLLTDMPDTACIFALSSIYFNFKLSKSLSLTFTNSTSQFERYLLSNKYAYVYSLGNIDWILLLPIPLFDIIKACCWLNYFIIFLYSCKPSIFSFCSLLEIVVLNMWALHKCSSFGCWKGKSLCSIQCPSLHVVKTISFAVLWRHICRCLAIIFPLLLMLNLTAQKLPSFSIAFIYSCSQLMWQYDFLSSKTLSLNPPLNEQVE